MEKLGFKLEKMTNDKIIYKKNKKHTKEKHY